MPGLMRGMARTAVIAGTATHVSNNVSRRQASRWSQNQPAQQAAPAAPAPSDQSDELVVELQKLAELKNQGILTEEEFSAKKKQMLGL